MGSSPCSSFYSPEGKLWYKLSLLTKVAKMFHKYWEALQVNYNHEVPISLHLYGCSRYSLAGCSSHLLQYETLRQGHNLPIMTFMDVTKRIYVFHFIGSTGSDQSWTDTTCRLHQTSVDYQHTLTHHMISGTVVFRSCSSIKQKGSHNHRKLTKSTTYTVNSQCTTCVYQDYINCICEWT